MTLKFKLIQTITKFKSNQQINCIINQSLYNIHIKLYKSNKVHQLFQTYSIMTNKALSSIYQIYQSPPISFLLFTFLCLSFSIISTKYTILTSPLQISYDQFNAIKLIKIRFRPELPILYNDNLMLSFSEPLQSVPGDLPFSLYDQYKKQLISGTFNFKTDSLVSSLNLQYFQNALSSNYVCQMSKSIWLLGQTQIESKWLTIILNIPQDLMNSFANRLGSLNIAIFSSLDVNHIDYQSSNRFSYFYFASLAASPPPVLLNANIANDLYGNSGQKITQTPGQIYPIYLQITPSIDFHNFILNIQFSTMTSSNLSTLNMTLFVKDYQFYGNCYFICKSTINCITEQYCLLTTDKIQVKITEMLALQKYVLRFNVINPPYQTSKNILLWVDQIGSINDTALIVPQQLNTSLITITSDELKLFWGIPYSVVNSTMELGFFVDGGINTVQVGFIIDKPSPFSEALEVIVYIGSTQLAIQSINHNLPMINLTPTYQFVPPYLKIKNVAALTRNGTRYWVSFRTKYKSTDNLNLIGSVDIKLKNYPPNKILFQALNENSVKNVIPFANLTDWVGFNGPSFRNIDTQVITATDNMLENSTAQAIRKYFNEATNVGIDPTIKNQQLLFLLNVPQINMYLTGNTNETYETKLFYNPNIFQSVSDKGLEVVAYNQTNLEWNAASNDCYRNQIPLNYTTQTYMCQKYNDHVFDQQLDNRLILDSYFNYYSFICGNGTNVVCLDTTCKQQCRLFKGYNGLTGGSGIASIRNATFIPGYQSPVQATNKNLDFVFCFYHGGIQVSCTLINGYTVKFQPLLSTRISFINTYNDGVLYNKGDQIPTLIKISGKLSVTEYINLGYPTVLKLYLPASSTGFKDFYKNDNSIGCTYLCKVNQSYSQGMSQSWLQMNIVSIQNIPPMTNDFKILIPIQLLNYIYSIYIGFQSQGRTMAIYRFEGSSINHPILSPRTYLYQTLSQAYPWNLVTNWTVGPSFTYFQSINLEQTNSGETFTTIQMGDSSMPFYNNPYVTVSIQQLQILSEYTNIVAGNSILNRTCDKLTYFYLNKRIQCFICQLFTNVNTTNNNIRIEYPLFDNNLGPGYPFDKIFSFAYAADSNLGEIQGFRNQKGNKVKINSCISSKSTQYHIGQVGRQLQIYRFQTDPIFMSIDTFTKIRLQIELPINIQPSDCSIDQVIYRVDIACNVVNFTANVTTLQLSLVNSADTVKLIEFYLNINCYQNGNVTLNSSSFYRARVFLPHTDAMNLSTVYGVSFSPYSSIAQKCQNSFTYINSAYNSTILISSYALNAISLNMNAQLLMNISMSKQKSHLLEYSYIQLTFTGLQVTQLTFCYFPAFKHKFYKRTTLTTSKYTLYNNQILKGFTLATQVHCSNLILKSLSSTVKIQIFDISASKIVLNSTITPLVPTSIFYSNATIVPVTSLLQLPNTLYKSLGFNAQYTIDYGLSSGTGGLVQGYIDLSQYYIDSRLLDCTLPTLQPVYCKPIYLNSGISPSIQLRSRFIYFKTYFNSSFSSLKLKIYPILQQKMLTNPYIRTMLLLNGLAYSSSLMDTLPFVVVDDIFLINSYSIIPVITPTNVIFNLQIKYKLFVSINRPLYIQLGEILFYNLIDTSVVLKCTIDMVVVVPCRVVEKDLIVVDISSYMHNISQVYSLVVQSFQANYQIEKYDPQNFFIRMFIIDTATKQVDFVSSIQQSLSKSVQIVTLINSFQSYSNRQYLVWKTRDPITGYQTLPKIYYGYYGPPIELITKDGSKFKQDYNLSSLNYTIPNFDNTTDFNCMMGYQRCNLHLTANSRWEVIQKLTFTHNSTQYWQPYSIFVEVSNQLCVITTEFTNYKIFQNGLTIPIILNFTQCRPRQILQIVTSFNPSDSLEVSVDPNLSQLKITFDNPIGIIFVRHQSSVTSLKSYNLSLSLSGTYAASFVIPSFIMIDKITRTQSTIQAKVPQVLQLYDNRLTVRVQCNEPSSVYWVLGFYPTPLGVQGQDIQARLLNGQVGIKPYVYDSLTYGNLQYGLNYTERANIWKSILIQNLIGNTTYLYKYFCVNINGIFSDGKMITLNTPLSASSFVKITLGFNKPLQYSGENNYACAIAQSLTIPYAEVITSVNSNCKNSPLIYYKTLNDTTWDYSKIQNDKVLYYHHFYINSPSSNSFLITSTVRAQLFKNMRILTQQIPLWASFKIQLIQPDMVTPGFFSAPQIQMSTNTISVKYPISNSLSYVVAGLISVYFNASTMSIPEPYLIKMGKFSETVDFDKVYMNFTTGNITFNFGNLSANTQYSIFYFITVDDPRINSKHSEVQYLNLMTHPYLNVDLFQQKILSKLTLILSLLLVSLMFLG